MIQVIFVTRRDIENAQKKLLVLHKKFEKPCEQEAAIDFENCLGKRLKSGTAIDFLIACENAADDLLDPKKVPETYDQFTVGIMKNMTNVFAEELFGPRFAREVQDFIESRELV